MQKYYVITLLFILLLGGCASSKQLQKEANQNAKAGEYYESIGQPNAAQQERSSARSNRKEAFRIETLLYDIFFGGNDKKKSKS
ncbi:MAG: hypothetical protein ACPG46_09350 [Thalassotalea sp.]